MTKETKEKTSEVSKTKRLIAKKNHTINCPPHLVRVIKQGDDLSDLPEKFIIHLKNNEVL
jgi:hypothetical protein